MKSYVHSVWYKFNVNLIKREKLRKQIYERKWKGMYIGVWYKFNVNLIIKNNEKTSQQERVLVDTLAVEFVHARLWFIVEYI